ncbi:UNVERIFIED_ORG: hypothetical protein J2Y81_005042 [Paraburkholderia sediminicola]|jgi:hypothetical protein|nr:hypothetical protein [Paraburkholderia sediminicola]
MFKADAGIVSKIGDGRIDSNCSDDLRPERS